MQDTRAFLHTVGICRVSILLRIICLRPSSAGSPMRCRSLADIPSSPDDFPGFDNFESKNRKSIFLITNQTTEVQMLFIINGSHCSKPQEVF